MKYDGGVVNEKQECRRSSLGRRKSVTVSLLMILVVFCGAIGFGLGSNAVSVWSTFVFSVAAIAAIQIGYMIAGYYLYH